MELDDMNEIMLAKEKPNDSVHGFTGQKKKAHDKIPGN